MKFQRFPKTRKEPEYSPARMRAAQKAVITDHEKNALTPDLIRDVSASERLVRLDKAHHAYWLNLRNFQAKTWRAGRTLLRQLAPLTKKGTLLAWSKSSYPADASYFTEFVREIACGKRNPWTDMRRRRQLFLVGQGRLPKNLFFKEMQPKGEP